MSNIRYFIFLVLLSLSCTVKKTAERETTKTENRLHEFTEKMQEVTSLLDTLDVVILTHDTIIEQGKAPKVRHTRKEVKAKRKMEKVEEGYKEKTDKGRTVENVKTLEHEEKETTPDSKVFGYLSELLFFSLVICGCFLVFKAYRAVK